VSQIVFSIVIYSYRNVILTTAIEEKGKMIKFLCDSCGRDIAAKVQDSVEQFCGRDHFEPNRIPGVTEAESRHLPDAPFGAGPERKPVYLEVQLLNELSKLIHASAWGMSAAMMQCGNCAKERAEKRRGKVTTIFTRIAEV
jgi:hypothetical protein